MTWPNCSFASLTLLLWLCASAWPALVLIAIRETGSVTKAMAPALLEQELSRSATRRRKESAVIGRNAKADRDASLESPDLDIREMPALAGPATAMGPVAPGPVAAVPVAALPAAALPAEM